METLSPSLSLSQPKASTSAAAKMLMKTCPSSTAPSPRPVFVDHCLICNHACYLAQEVEPTERKRVGECRQLFYALFTIPVSKQCISTLKEELPLCANCLFKLGRLRTLRDQLTQIQREFTKLKEDLAFDIVDIVASSGRGVTGWRDVGEDVLAQSLTSAEVDTLQQIVFEDWHERHPSPDQQSQIDMEVKKKEHTFLEPSPPQKKPQVMKKNLNFKMLQQQPMYYPLLPKLGRIRTPKLPGLNISRNGGFPPAPIFPRPRVVTSSSPSIATSASKTTVISITTPEDGKKGGRSGGAGAGGGLVGGLKRRLSSSSNNEGKSIEILVEEKSPGAIKTQKFEDDGEGELQIDEGNSISVSRSPQKSPENGSKHSSKDDSDDYMGVGDFLEGGGGHLEEEGDEDAEGEEAEGEVATADPKYVESLIAQLQQSGDAGGGTSIEFLQNEEGLYVCMFCSKTFIHKYPYRDHLKTHTGEGPRCPITNCNKIFPKNHNLMLHLRTHTGEKPFSCDVCHKGFADKSNLKVHYRVHTGEKPYKCDFCDQAFVNSSRLVVHRRLHTGEKPHRKEEGQF